MKSNMSDSDNEDFYQLLEVPREASDAEIKKAYRRLALRYHPDKNPEQQEKAEKRFKKIGEAYEVLSNKEKRLNYDRFGKSGLDHTTPNFNNPFHNFTFHDPKDIFAQVFGEDPFKNFHNHFHSSPFTDDFPSFFSRQSSQDSAYSTGDSSSESGSENGDDPFNLHDRFFGGFSSHHNLHENLWKNKGSGRGSRRVSESRRHTMCFPSHFNFNDGSSNSTPRKPGTCKSTSISTKYVNGKKIVTKTVKEGRTETVTIEEDGYIIEQTVKTL